MRKLSSASQQHGRIYLAGFLCNMTALSLATPLLCLVASYAGPIRVDLCSISPRITLLDLLRFMLTWGLPFTLYIVLQVFTVIRLRGLWRLVAVLPVPVMTYVVYVTADAYYARSNMWPILLILISPCAVIFLVVLLFVFRNRSKPH